MLPRLPMAGTSTKPASNEPKSRPRYSRHRRARRPIRVACSARADAHGGGKSRAEEHRRHDHQQPANHQLRRD